MHVLLELALDPRPVGDLLDVGPSLIGPPSTYSSLPLPLYSPFLARIVMWCELDLLPVTSELNPPSPSLFNWILSLGLLRLQFCLIAIQAPTQKRATQKFEAEFIYSK